MVVELVEVIRGGREHRSGKGKLYVRVQKRMTRNKRMKKRVGKKEGQKRGN